MNNTRRQHLQILAAGLAGLAVPAWAQTVAEQAAALEKKDKKTVPLPKVGAPFPLPATVPLIDGTTLKTADWTGKVVVVEYWATWCPFCARQMPHMEELYKKEHARGLEVLALSIDKKPSDVPPFIKEKGYTFPVAWMSKDLARELPKPPGLPVTIVIGRDGKVIAAESGEMFPEDIAGIAKHL